MIHSDEAICIEELSVAYNYKPVLWDIHLDIPKSSFMAVIGPNGAGKTTLLKSIVGILKPISGTIRIFGEKYKKVKKKCAYVPQKNDVDWSFPVTVFDVVLMGTYGELGLIRRPKKEHKQRVLEALEKVGMSEFKNRQISELSGGQQQRVFIARALVQNAEILLLDEPLQGIDKKTEEAIMELLKKLNKEGKTIIATHHDLQTVKEYFQDVMLINFKLIASGKVSEVFTPENIKLTYEVNR